MSNKIYVFSTLSAPVDYTVFVRGGGDLPLVEKVVTINGNAGIAGKFLETPRGAATLVTDADVAALEENTIFQLHKKNGYVTISDSADAGDVDNVVADLTGRDKSAPLVPGDYPEEAAVQAPTTASTKRK